MVAEAMAEMVPAQVSAPSRSLQAWQAVLNWFAFLFQALLQITPSLAQLLSFIRLRQPIFISPSSSSAAAFKPLPVELTVPDLPATPHASADKNDAVDKLTVVLDLDETLVCAYEASSLPSVIRTQAIEGGLKWFELECIFGDEEGEGKQRVNHVLVFERPGLHQFLKEISEFADLVLFTAGLEGYARPLVDRIDLEKRFDLRLYRPSTINTKYRQHVKDLSCLSKDLRRTVIVDNNPFSFLLQPMNGIPCVPFSAGQPYDKQLLGFVLPLLKSLSLHKDVRPVLLEKFRMPEWFQKQGILASDWSL